jgi:hypothetical protein
MPDRTYSNVVVADISQAISSCRSNRLGNEHDQAARPGQKLAGKTNRVLLPYVPDATVTGAVNGCSAAEKSDNFAQGSISYVSARRIICAR